MEDKPTTIKAGAKFESFKEFETVLEQWKIDNYHPFRVASSETLRMPDGSMNDTFKYRYIVYHCAHYGTPRMRGTVTEKYFSCFIIDCTVVQYCIVYCMTVYNCTYSQQCIRNIKHIVTSKNLNTVGRCQLKHKIRIKEEMRMR